MKKLLLLLFVLLNSFATADKCEDCLKKCESVGILKRNACKSDCIIGPCLE